MLADHLGIGRGGQPCDVAARAPEAGDQARSHWIERVQHDDRDRSCRLSGGLDPGRIGRHDGVDLETEKLGREAREPLGLPLRKPVVDRDVLTLDPTEVAQPVEERVNEMRDLRRARSDAEPADAGHPRGLLSADAVRPAEEREDDRAEELSSVHYRMSSSVRARTGGGLVSPSVLAIFMLMSS